MKKNRLVLSDAGVADIIEQAEWYSTQSGTALAGRWERAVTSATLRVVSRPTTGAPCTFQSSVLRNVLRTAIRGSPSIRFSTGLTPKRYSSSAWYAARETWNVCYRFIRARGAPSAWGTLFWGLAHPFNHLNPGGAPHKFERSKRASPRTVYVNGIGPT